MKKDFSKQLIANGNLANCSKLYALHHFLFFQSKIIFKSKKKEVVVVVASSQHTHAHHLHVPFFLITHHPKSSKAFQAN
jgi:hypothetical protein